MAQNDGQFVSNANTAECTQNYKSNSVAGSADAGGGGVVASSTTTAPTPSSSSANSGSASGKKLRRAFSMPRNPFRLSRRFKSGGSVPGKDLPNTDETTDGVAENGATPLAAAAAPASITNGTEAAAGVGGDNSTTMSTMTVTKNTNNKHRLFRRTSWKKFLSRIAQQMTSINIGVSVFG